MTTRFDKRFGRGCGTRLGVVLLTLATLCAVQRAPAAAQECVGDCSNDGAVTVDELLKGVNIALDTLSMGQCLPFDMNGDSAVTVGEILVAVNNALSGCPSGELTFDKISLAVFPGGEETLTVTATEDSGPWTAASSDPNIVSVLKIGDKINVTGVSLGKAAIMVTTQSRLRRTVPVRVYDPTVLDAGEILIRYVDTFQCIFTDDPRLGEPPGSYYRPVVPSGWRSLGSFAYEEAGCPDIDGKAWMMIVKENPEHPPADPNVPPLYTRGIDYAESIGIVVHWPQMFWVPKCGEGYVGMGITANVSPGQNPPDRTEITCVRKDLTVPGVDAGTIVPDWSYRIGAPENSNYQSTTAYVETGTFYLDQRVMNVLAVELPTLIDMVPQSWTPHLTSFAPIEIGSTSEPVLAKTLLVPFTMVLNDTDPADPNAYKEKGVGWMVENSPFVLVGREQAWTTLYWFYNSTNKDSEPVWRTVTKGISDTEGTTYSHKAGLAVTVKTGVQFLGTGGEVSATVSYEFGYATQTSVTEFQEQADTIKVGAPAHKAAALWQLHSNIFVKLHNRETGQLEEIARLPVADSLSYVLDDYPDD